MTRDMRHVTCVIEHVTRDAKFVTFQGEPNQNGDEDCAAIDSQAEGYGVRLS